jgi:RNA-directed DNA polymerase
MNNASEEMKHLHLVTDPAWLMQAWEEIRSNKGSMTAGIDSTIATDIDPERIQRLSERLRTGRYRPKPVRRVYIAKSNGKMRP